MKFFPSSSAFMLGELVVTKYNSGCLRSILIKANGVTDGEIAKLHQDVGKAHEAGHAEDLRREGKWFVPETVLRSQLSPNVEYSGRADFVVYDSNDEPLGVDECKGYTSKNTRRAIRKGEVNPNHLAQLVSYMFRLRRQTGRLVYGYYEETNDLPPVLVCQEKRVFDVEITDEGTIGVDNTPSGYSIGDLLAHQTAAVQVLESQTIGPRPAEAMQKYGGPCSLCPFRAACDKYDQDPCSTPEFIQHARDAVAALPAKPEPKVFKVKQPRGKKK